MQVAELGTPYVAMHMRGDPGTMQVPENTAYADVCADVGAELQAAAERAVAAGVQPWRIILDPGARLHASVVGAFGCWHVGSRLLWPAWSPGG